MTAFRSPPNCWPKSPRPSSLSPQPLPEPRRELPATGRPARRPRAAAQGRREPRKPPRRPPPSASMSTSIENLMTLISELVLTRNQLLQMQRGQKDNEFKVPLQRLSHITSDLQDGVTRMRMQPIGNAWNKLPRIVRDLAVETGKKIELTMQGAETELDRQVLEMIKDPLTHMVRNSADHGIEDGAAAPGGRQAGDRHHRARTPITKAATSSSASPMTAAAWMWNASARRRSPTAWRPKPPSPAMSEQQILQFIFRAGFSTAEKVTSVSGRGVGMDVVRTNIERIGGTIELTSVAGRGTTFLIKIPLTLAIVSALIVEAARPAFRHSPAQCDRTGQRLRARSEARHRNHQQHAGAAAARPAAAAGVAARGPGPSAAGRRRTTISSSWRRWAAPPSASSSTACSTPRKSWSSRSRRSCAARLIMWATPSWVTAASS